VVADAVTVVDGEATVAEQVVPEQSSTTCSIANAPEVTEPAPGEVAVSR
jgi:hypothetical protein